MYKITKDNMWLTKAFGPLDILLDFSRIHDYSGHCWGAEYPAQSTKFYTEVYYPRAVITVEVAEAFLDAYEITSDMKFLSVAKSAADFITKDLNVIENDEKGICYSYIPGSNWKVINANAKTACFLARLSSITDDEQLKTIANANMRWVLGKQTDYGAWFYADPAKASHVAHDNYHTGFILSSLLEYIIVTDEKSWLDAYAQGLDYYERELFLPNGAPKWRSSRVYPLDIHGAAQGILSFSQASAFFPEKLTVARRIADWTFANMLDSDGRFYYQKGRLWTKKYTLMRWCQAWMCYALSVFAKSLN